MDWKTSITEVIPDHIRIRGYEVGDLMENLDLGQGVFLLLKGELPSPKQGKMMNALLLAVMDHSVMAPSACAARFVASGGSPIQSAVAAGLQALGAHHGGAIEEAQYLFTEGVKSAREEGKSITEKAKEVVTEYGRDKKRLPGFGHPYHKQDPRTVKLMELAERLNLGGEHIEFCNAVAEAITDVMGKKLVINVDAAMAATLADMGFQCEMARGFFIISRAAGLVAHAFEEYTRERPFRAVGRDEVTYDGPEPRKL